MLIYAQIKIINDENALWKCRSVSILHNYSVKFHFYLIKQKVNLTATMSKEFECLISICEKNLEISWGTLYISTAVD